MLSKQTYQFKLHLGFHMFLHNRFKIFRLPGSKSSYHIHFVQFYILHAAQLAMLPIFTCTKFSGISNTHRPIWCFHTYSYIFPMDLSLCLSPALPPPLISLPFLLLPDGWPICSLSLAIPAFTSISISPDIPLGFWSVGPNHIVHTFHKCQSHTKLTPRLHIDTTASGMGERRRE